MAFKSKVARDWIVMDGDVAQLDFGYREFLC
jgi:hypothetical protein